MTFAFFGHKFQATLVLLLAALPGFSFAVDHSIKPEASVPTVSYRSVFRETSLGVERDQTNWRKANDDVGKFSRGHVDILKLEEAETKAMSTKPATPATAPTPRKQ